MVVLFVALSALSVFLLEGERKRNRLLVQYEAERLASALLESFRGNRGRLESSLSDDILGFGVYAMSGEPVYRVGSAPDRIQDQEASDRLSVFTFDKDQRTIVLVRKLGFLPERMPMMPMMRRHGHDPRIGPVQSLWLQVRLTEFWTVQRRYGLGFLVIPLVIAAALGITLYLHRKNTRYRRTLERRERLAQLGEIARTLAHEIRNPLSAIRIRTGILKRIYTDRGTEDIEIIEDEVEHLSSLTEKIGDFLKNPMGQPEVIDLADFLRNLLSRFEESAGVRIVFEPGDLRGGDSARGGDSRGGDSARAGDSLHADVPGGRSLDVPPAGGPLVRFDRERLRSVVENLIRNALESTRDDRLVTVRLAGAGGRTVVVKILDSGEGIPVEMRDRLFDPFTTTKVKGSGIGLSISRRFVEAAGGSLILAPRREGGTEARVSLPRIPSCRTGEGSG